MAVHWFSSHKATYSSGLENGLEKTFINLIKSQDCFFYFSAKLYTNHI